MNRNRIHEKKKKGERARSTEPSHSGDRALVLGRLVGGGGSRATCCQQLVDRSILADLQILFCVLCDSILFIVMNNIYFM
jgi:hypothetical protein